MATGVSLGYLVRVRVSRLLLISMALLLVLLPLAITLGIAGVLCSLVLASIIVIPLVGGLALGFWVRRMLTRRRAGKFSYTPMLLLFLHSAGWILVEKDPPDPFPLEIVETSRVIEWSARQAWEAMRFYEDVRLGPPLLARIGLPYPVGTEGVIQRVGDTTICRYSSGHLKKLVTDYQPYRLLAFNVIEQEGIEDRSVRLVSGSFPFTPLSEKMTLVTLTTTYQPLLAARLLWRPFEKSLGGALHAHVLDGIEYNALLSRQATQHSHDGRD